jgi:NhaP-type Na+/H+ or K+/H+ antiporter
MTPDYDPRVIQKYAASLYRQALWLAIGYSIVGGFVGWALGWTLIHFSIAHVGSGDTTALVIGLAGGLLGFANGYSKGLALRVEAQLALCHMRIEENTRRIGLSVSDGASALRAI